MEQVLPDIETRPLETVNVYIATIDPKKTNHVLKFIRNQLPATKGLDHLKQIRRHTATEAIGQLDIILCQESAITFEELTALLTKFELATHVKPRIHGVPLYPPLTREQFEIWKLAWPTAFREDTSRHPVISDHEREIILKHMRHTWGLTKDAVSKDELPSVAAIVDPATGKVLAAALDTRNSTGHILNHAVMNCVEAVAKREREAFDQAQSDRDAEKEESEERESSQSKEASPTCGHKRKTHPTSSAASTPPPSSYSDDHVTPHKRIALDANAPLDLLAFEAATPEQQDGLSEDSSSSSTRPMKKAYLCTGYDVYLTHEPCVMCSMALVHSRVGRVFYTVPMAASGGLGSVHKIHSHPGLNHHFFVYQYVGYEEVKYGSSSSDSGESEDDSRWEAEQGALDLETENVDC